MTQEQLDAVSVDYAGMSGPIASALVRDNLTPFAWLESVTFIGYYCEDETHTGENCACVTEDTIRRGFLRNIEARGLWLTDD